MSDTGAAPGMGDLFSLLGTPNPFSAVTRSLDQFRRGVDEFLKAVENFNDTMEQMNGVAMRMNRFLDDVEEPVRTLMPQVTRTLKAADVMVEQLSGPVERVAPGLARLGDVLANPNIGRIPSDLSDVVELLGEVARRLQPLTQLAESAGGMLGLRSLGNLRGLGFPSARPAESADSAPVRRVPVERTSPARAVTEAAPTAHATKQTSKKPSASKTSAATKKPATAKKTGASKKSAAAKKSAAKKPAR